MLSSAELEEILLQAVDEALLIPGEIVRTAIYERIERSYQLRREEIPEKLETFHRALQELLGAGGRAMETLIESNPTPRTFCGTLRCREGIGEILSFGLWMRKSGV